MKRALALLAIPLFLAACESLPTETPLEVESSFAKWDTHENFRQFISGYAYSSCNDELVYLEGNAHWNIKSRTVGDVMQVDYHVNTADLAGTGQTTGLRYNYIVGQVQRGSQTMTPPFPYSFDVDVRVKLVSQGRADNDYQRAKYTFSWDGTTFSQEFKMNEAGCAG